MIKITLSQVVVFCSILLLRILNECKTLMIMIADTAKTKPEALRYGEIYSPNAMADRAIGAENPIVSETHPDK